MCGEGKRSVSCRFGAYENDKKRDFVKLRCLICMLKVRGMTKVCRSLPRDYTGTYIPAAGAFNFIEALLINIITLVCASGPYTSMLKFCHRFRRSRATRTASSLYACLSTYIEF